MPTELVVQRLTLKSRLSVFASASSERVCARIFPAPLQALHARMEPLLLFFIDGASLIDKEDDDWELLLAVMPASQAQGGGTLVVRAEVACVLQHAVIYCAVVHAVLLLAGPHA